MTLVGCSERNILAITYMHLALTLSSRDMHVALTLSSRDMHVALSLSSLLQRPVLPGVG